MSLDDLIALTADATRRAVQDLFGKQPGEEFYYVSLICTGALPFLSAWSVQALERTAAAQNCGPDLLKWSYADSPYCAYRLDLFEPLREQFELTSSTLGSRDPADQIELALQVSEAAMAQLDRDGVFGVGSQRNGIVIGAEVMPPDWTNTERLERLNPEAALAVWLRDASEPRPD